MSLGLLNNESMPGSFDLAVLNPMQTSINIIRLLD